MVATSIDEVIDQLEQIIQDAKVSGSSLGYFAALYQNVTIHIRERLGQNYFDDDQRMERFDVVFANRYLSAYAAYQAGQAVTASWKVAFEASRSDQLIVLQHLLLGMNAHINLDLGIAAASITDETTIDELRPDFNRINEVLATLVEEVQKDLIEIWPRLFAILKFFKKFDDLLINFSMKLARDGAWRFAKKLAGQQGAARDQAIAEKDGKVFKIADKITNNGILLGIVFRLIRIGERGTTVDKIQALEALVKNKLAQFP